MPSKALKFLAGSLFLALALAGFLGVSSAQISPTEEFLQWGRSGQWGQWGPYSDSLQLNRESAVARHNYCPTGGCVLRVDGISVEPSRARRGDTLRLRTTYTLLTPEGIPIPITFTREIFFQGKSLGRTKDIDARNPNGTFNRDINFTLPANSPPGEYTIVTKVATGYGEDMKSTQFLVVQ